MADEQSLASGRLRSRGPKSNARTESLERLKALQRGGGRRSESGGFQIKLENPIYDTVEEDEYDALVAKRREEAKAFIVDDEGLGYGDEGEEEDWSKSNLPFSSDESDGERERPKRKKTEKREPQPKKPSASSASLSAAAAMMGKQKISSMYTSQLFKKPKDDKAKGLSGCDSIVDDVIAEFAPDENDRERRRRAHPQPQLQLQPGSISVSKSFAPVGSVKSESLSLGGVNFVSRNELANEDVTNGASVLDLERNREEAVEEKSLIKESEGGGGAIVESDEFPSNEGVIEEEMMNGVEMKAESVVKKEGKGYALNAKIKKESDPALSATAGWQAVRSGGNGSIGGDVAKEVSNGSSCEESPDFDLDSDGSLPFYIIDAHEEFYGANMGNVYLFGKVT
jgi:DNA polymerase alpha subunit A